MSFFISLIRRQNCNCLRHGNRIECWFVKSNITYPFDARQRQEQSILTTNTGGKVVFRQK